MFLYGFFGFKTRYQDPWSKLQDSWSKFSSAFQIQTFKSWILERKHCFFRNKSHSFKKPFSFQNIQLHHKRNKLQNFAQNYMLLTYSRLWSTINFLVKQLIKLNWPNLILNPNSPTFFFHKPPHLDLQVSLWPLVFHVLIPHFDQTFISS